MARGNRAGLRATLTGMKILWPAAFALCALTLLSCSPLNDQMLTAAHAGDFETVMLLLGKGAGINAQSAAGNTVLKHAVLNKRLDMVRYFIDIGAKVTIKNKEGDTALHDATFIFDDVENSIETVQYLVEHGADVNARNRYGSTPLSNAANHMHPPLIQYLIDKGAEVNAKDNEGDTPLFNATFPFHNDVIAALLRNGADINAVNKAGETPIFQVVRRGNLDTLMFFVKNGADIRIRNRKGQTAEALARQIGQAEMADYLAERR